MDDKFKNLGFRDFVNVDYTQENDDLIAYQAKKRHRGVVGETMDPRDYTDKPGYVVVVKNKKGEEEIKHYSPYKPHADRYARKVHGGPDKATVYKTDGRKIMKEEVEQVDEVISRTERLKRGQRMKRMSKRIQMAKKRALKRAPSMDVLQKRARKQAKSQMIQKWTRGKDKSELSIGRRADLEKRLKKMGPRLDRMVKKLMPDLRKQDRERRSGSKDKK